MMNEREQIPTDSAEMWCDHGHRGIRGDRGVHGVATGAEDFDADLRGEMVGRCNRAAEPLTDSVIDRC